MIHVRNLRSRDYESRPARMIRKKGNEIEHFYLLFESSTACEFEFAFANVDEMRRIKKMLELVLFGLSARAITLITINCVRVTESFDEEERKNCEVGI